VKPAVIGGYRYYLPTFVGASAGRTPRRRVVCRECVSYWDSPQDRCGRYLATVDSNGYRYCANCGHRDEVHPR